MVLPEEEETEAAAEPLEDCFSCSGEEDEEVEKEKEGEAGEDEEER